MTWTNSILLILLTVALAIRLLGINFGYWHGDENINLAAKVLAGELIPAQHYYPPFFNYVVAGGFAVLYGIGRLIPVWWNLEEFRQHYFLDPAPFFLTARFITALLASTIAPLFYLTSRAYGNSVRSSVISGVLAVFLPVTVMTAHVSKSDILMAAALIMLVYILFMKLNSPKENKWDYLAGLAVVLAISFKHSAIFPISVLAVGMLILLVRVCDSMSLLKSAGRIVLVCLILLPLFNIGIILDISNFLEYQKIQTLMSYRDDSWTDTILEWKSWFVSPTYGIGIVAFFIWLLIPLIIGLLRFDTRSFDKDWLLWITVFLSALIVMSIVGKRQQEFLLVPYMTLSFLSVCLIIGRVIDSPTLHKTRIAALVSAGVIFIISIYGTSVISRQALAKPVNQQVAEFLKAYIGDQNKKVWTLIDIPLPVSEAASRDRHARHENLARKYNIQLPARASDRRSRKNSENNYYIWKMEFVIGGLEIYEDDQLDIIKPYAWPLQKEEWTLDYWLKKDITILVIPAHIYNTGIAAYLAMYQDIQKRCKLLQKFDARKPLFLERNTEIFDCSQAASSS